MVGPSIAGAADQTSVQVTVCAKTSAHPVRSCTYTTISAALAAASSGEVITLKAGKYSGGFIISTPVTIRGAGQGVTTISGGGKQMRPVVEVNANPVTVSGVTISGATVPSTGGSGYGGGVLTEPGALLNLGFSYVEDNQDNHGAGGGGISSLGTTDCTRCNIVDNASHGRLDQAGGVHVGGRGIVHMTGGSVKANVAGWGGGFDVDSGGSLTITGGQISDNTANQGGGIMDNGAATLNSSKVVHNVAKGGIGYGGGIFVTDGSTTTLDSTPVTNNKTDNFVRA